MTTDCNSPQLEFQGLTRRAVVASFDGGTLTSDGGALLLAEVDRRLGLLEQFARLVSRTIESQIWWSIASRSWCASACSGWLLAMRI